VKGTNRFTAAQADRIRALLRARAVAERVEQKRLRDELRAMGFYISDWSGPGFTQTDFDRLVRTGAIVIVDDRGVPPAAAALPAPPSDPSPTSVPGRAGARRAAITQADATSDDAVARQALVVLSGTRHTLAEAAAHVPSVAGLYAIYGDATVWAEVGLGAPPDERPLYVGKAEASLVSRDLDTHFGSGRTGSSTVRRSFAALLCDSLDLHAQPRNPAKPERPANYGLADDGDRRLSDWMRHHLTLAVWAKREGVRLLNVERAVLECWKPPLNLKDVLTPWTGQVSAARMVMADQARAWARERGFQI